MKKLTLATIIWNVAIILITILFIAHKMSDMGWLLWSLATTLACTAVASKEEKADNVTSEKLK